MSYYLITDPNNDLIGGNNKYYFLIINGTKNDQNYINCIDDIIDDNYKIKKTLDYLSIKINKQKNDKFSVKLYDLDNNIIYQRKRYDYEMWNVIINKVRSNNKVKSKLSLYADYHPETSKKKLGFKNKEIAIETIKAIKNKPIIYQFQVINTMYNRAKYHPWQTKDMIEAMKIFKKWLINY
jgi:hypothetical protein